LVVKPVAYFCFGTTQIARHEMLYQKWEDQRMYSDSLSASSSYSFGGRARFGGIEGFQDCKFVLCHLSISVSRETVGLSVFRERGTSSY
jgi:hypothetical protein